jgi:integrase/recombinase XerD
MLYELKGKESTVKCIINDHVVLSQPLEGPLATPMASFAQWGSEQGYSYYALHRKILLASDFSRWLGHQGLLAQDVSDAHPGQYLQDRARRVRLANGDASGLRQFMAFLRREGVIAANEAPPTPMTPIEQCLQEFEHYLRDECALAPATIINYLPFVCGLLTQRFANAQVRLADLRASDVVDFVRHQAPQLHLSRAKLMTTALRSFLQYARYRGDLTLDLAAAIPPVASWSRTSIPRAIPADQVERLLASIERRSAMGRRDHAILLLLARLGLRSSEIVFLELDDMDWAAGTFSVRGKNGRRTEFPLPAEVGQAIVAYLQHGRPCSTSRRVFLRHKAPIRGFLNQCAIGSIVRHAIQRANIQAPTLGAHQFRHALATHLLQRGASLTEIGEVLGHRSPETTKIYAKVHIDALRTLALPWPGGVQ